MADVALVLLLVALLRGARGAGPPGIVNLDGPAALVVAGRRKVEGCAMRDAPVPLAAPPDDDELDEDIAARRRGR